MAFEEGADVKLVIEMLSPWPVHHVGSGTYDARAEISLIITPLEEIASREVAWKERVLRIALPAFTEVEVLSDAPGESLLAWPIDIIDSRIVEAGDVIETRLTVLYTMLEWCAAAILRGTPARIAAERDRALRVLLSGRPDWSRPEVVALAQLRGEA
jgi:hypothetical protein